MHAANLRIGVAYFRGAVPRARLGVSVSPHMYLCFSAKGIVLVYRIKAGRDRDSHVRYFSMRVLN